MVLKAQKSKVNVPTDLVPSESAFPHLQTVTRSLSIFTIASSHGEDRERSSLSFSSYKDTNPDEGAQAHELI